MATSETPTIRQILRSRRGERGQAMPLAALGLVIMSLAIIITLNLGQAVHQKIKLQNTADAAAYTLAAMEARTFNFLAFTNRVQIVHYNTAMAFQSYLSYAGYCLGMFGTLRDLVADVVLALRTGCAFPPPANVPYCALVGAFSAFSSIATMFFNIAKFAYKIMHKIIPWFTEAMSLFNKFAIYQMQLIRAVQINAHLLTGMNDFVKQNDPTMGYTATNNWLNMIVNATLNSLEYQSFFDRGGGANPYVLDLLWPTNWSKLATLFESYPTSWYAPDPTEPEVKDAQKVMSELANASRSHKNIYNRDNGGLAVATWIVASVFGKKMGSTKLVATGEPKPAVKQIREDSDESPTNYPIGDTVASDDYLTMGTGYGSAGIAWVFLLPNGAKAIGDGIVTDKDKGHHYKYDNSSSTGGAPAGFTSVIILPLPQGSVPKTFKKNADQDHKWPGLSPYFKFRPNSDPNADFGQPSTWMFLNKHHKNFQTGASSDTKRPWHYNFKWKHGTHPTASLDTTIGGERNSFEMLGGKLEGLNVVSRGMVYYHRPKTWDEHPNLFNPFWRARLAPVGAKLMNIYDKFVGSNVRTDSDNLVVQGIVNALRNFLGDIFLRTITTVMTH